MPAEEGDGLRADILGRIGSPPLHRLYDYWAARCRAGRLPGRRDIDPLELGFVLGSLLLVDVLRDPLRFRYRLTGTHIEDVMRIHGRTGTMVDEHPDPTFRKAAVARYAEVAQSGRPVSARRDALIDDRIRSYDLLMLPLAADGITVDMVLVGMWIHAP